MQKLASGLVQVCGDGKPHHLLTSCHWEGINFYELFHFCPKDISKYFSTTKLITSGK